MPKGELDCHSTKCDPDWAEVTSLEGIQSGSRLGKYQVLERMDGSERAFFYATSTEAGQAVCLLELREGEQRALAPAVRLEHAHLARVFEILEHEGTAFLVFERVSGIRLTQRLVEIGKKSTVDSVGSALRISDALGHLHEVAGVHGFLHTDSVILDPPERLGPVVTFSPIPANERTFHSPERGETGEPSVADDSWAAAGLLHMMLTGKPPPKEGYGSDGELEAAGVQDPDLRATLLHGLERDLSLRGNDVRRLRRELTHWFVEHAGEERASSYPQGGNRSSTLPPPLPAELLMSGSPGPAAARAHPVARPRRPRFLLLASGTALFGLIGSWAVSSWLAKPKVTLIERPVASAAAAPQSPKPIDLSEVPVTGAEPTVELDQTASCVSAYLPKGAFAKSPDFSWLCQETDPLKGPQKLRAAIVAAAPKTGGPTEAMKLFSRIGWYETAAYAVIRAGCCMDPAPLRPPEPGPGCESMADPLHELGRDVVAGKNFEEPLKRYTSAIHCELKLGRGLRFGRAARPQPTEEGAFRELAQAVAR